MTTLAPKARGEVIPLVSTSSEGVADCLIFAQEYSIRTRLAGLAGALLLGAAGERHRCPEWGASKRTTGALPWFCICRGATLHLVSLRLLQPMPSPAGRTALAQRPRQVYSHHPIARGRVRAWGCDSRRRSWAGRRAPGLSQHVFPDARRSRLGRTPLRCPSTRLPARSLSSTSRPSTT